MAGAGLLGTEAGSAGEGAPGIAMLVGETLAGVDAGVVAGPGVVAGDPD